MSRYFDLSLILAAVGLNGCAQLFLRKGMLSVGAMSNRSLVSTVLGTLASPAVWGGFACYAASLVLWLMVLSHVEVGRAYPMQGLGYVFVAVAGWWMLGESVSASQLIGIGVIWLGAYLVLQQ